MEITIDIIRDSESSEISGTCVDTTVNEERLITNVTTVTAGLVNVYTKTEVDNLFKEVTPKEITIETTENQVFFDMGEEFTEEFSITRNGVDLKEGIFSIVSPYFQYNQEANGDNPIKGGDILIFKYI